MVVTMGDNVAPLEVKGLSKIYEGKGKQVKAVDDVSFCLSDPQILVLLGPSGCGKTTTLRLIAGLEEPDSGEIKIQGRRVNELPPKDRHVSLIFQEYVMYPRKNVFENIVFPLEIRGVSKNERIKKVEEVAEFLQISDLLERDPSELSGGQRQRVALARALTTNPDIFLLDEPLASLDAKLKERMKIELKGLQREVGKPFIYVTHDQREALALADKIIVMRDGKVVQDDIPENLYSLPRDKWVAGFIGSNPMNFFKSRLKKQGSNYLVETRETSFQVPKGMATLIKNCSNRYFWLGVRAANMHRYYQKKEGKISGTIVNIEPREEGGLVSVESKKTQKRVDVLLKPSSLRDLQDGSLIHIGFNPKNVELFNEEGRNLKILKEEKGLN